MRTSEKGTALMAEYEGCELTAYKCPAGVWTIGRGHTPAKPGQTITQLEADELFRLDIEDREPALEKLLDGAPTTQGQWDAMMSLLYNIGEGNFAGSTVLKRHKLKNYMGAANAFGMWVRGGGKILPGLVRRREAERKLYLV
jgi:lysozyme